MMDLTLQYWHWILFGIALVISEIFMASFFIVWFGTAAIVVGGILWLTPDTSIEVQVFTWTILSTLLALAWFKFLKPLTIDKTKAGLSKATTMGEIGIILKPPIGDEKGKLRFPTPILGSEEWQIISSDTLAAGDRVRVINVSADSLVVEKAP